jgi:alkylated DNA nucleotide flippase Atl1
MPKLRKSWLAKLHDDNGCPKVEPITERLKASWGTGTVVIPAPLEVDALMRQVPSGELTTINEIRKALAVKHGATIGCPITTGIFAWIAANAADEQALGGEKDITPYWRTLRSDGALNQKYPGGVQKQALRLKEEGHTVVFFKGNKLPKVQDFEKKLAKLT